MSNAAKAYAEYLKYAARNGKTPVSFEEFVAENTEYLAGSDLGVADPMHY